MSKVRSRSKQYTHSRRTLPTPFDRTESSKFRWDPRSVFSNSSQSDNVSASELMLRTMTPLAGICTALECDADPICCIGSFNCSINGARFRRAEIYRIKKRQISLEAFRLNAPKQTHLLFEQFEAAD
jgi:hypothetical protein